jgi:hypothetical protein
MELLDTRFGREGYPKTVEYTESDKPERWQKQWNKRNALYSLQHKKQISRKDIFYNLNSQGYREQEWNQIDWNNIFIFLGCSHTFGCGVSLNETLPKIIQGKTSTYCVNLGIPGGSNFFSMLNSSYLINQEIKPKAVFYQRTYNSRWFDIEKNKVTTANNYKIDKDYLDFLDTNISTTIHSQWKHVCPVIEYCMEDYKDCGSIEYIARDGCHYNGLFFEKVSENLINSNSILKE